MTCSFAAAKVSFEPLDGVWTVGFSETSSGDGRYLLLQRDEHESEQDRKLGLVGEYVELNDQLCGAYSGVESVRLHRNNIELIATAGAAEKLREREVKVMFRLSDADFQALRSSLTEILGGSRVHVA